MGEESDETKTGINAVFLKMYRKLKASGIKHRQALEQTMSTLSEPKEKQSARTPKSKRRRK